MVHTLQGKLDATGIRFAVIISRFNSFIGERLLSGALDVLARHGAKQEDLTVVYVPGSFEIPLAARKLALSKKFDAVICLGALIRGETPHFDHLASVVTRGISAAGMDSGIPVIYGVLTCNTLEQAIDRAGAKSGNKGGEAAMAAIEMVQVIKQV